MDHVILLCELALPDPEVVKRALRQVRRFTEADAVRMAREPGGLLARNLSPEEASLVRRALEADGVAAVCLPAAQLPKLPQSRLLKRMEFQPQSWVIYDPLGRATPVPGAQVATVCAGAVRHFGLSSAVTQEWVRDHTGLAGVGGYRLETEVRHSVEDNISFRMEILLAGGGMRFEIEAENFLFGQSLSRPGLGPPEKLAMLIAQFKQHAPHLCLNRGAEALLANPKAPVVYSSRQALTDDSAWLLWRLASKAGGMA